MKSAAILLLMLLLAFNCVKAQTGIVKKDTLYYLVDTAKTPKLDRMLWIQHLKDNYIDYQIFCPCLMGSAGIYFTFPAGKRNINDTLIVKSTYIKPGQVKKLVFTSLIRLIQLAQQYNKDFNQRYVVFFVEYLPGGKYAIKNVGYGGSFIMEE